MYAPQNLDISGIPGIGKTLCVKNVIEEFQRGAKTTKRQFQYCYLNAMKIKRPHDIFKSLYLELTSHKERGLANETAVFILDDLLRKGTEP